MRIAVVAAAGAVAALVPASSSSAIDRVSRNEAESTLLCGSQNEGGVRSAAAVSVRWRSTAWPERHPERMR